jgi:phenylpropionate dioxygenase-like ring-hydroxylating dioxygenase large terminal subunit
VFLGDLHESERPPIPAFPEFGQPGWRAVHGDVKWNAHYTRVVENTADVAHTPFVHRASFGDPHATVIPELVLTTSEHAVEATIVLPRPAPPRQPKRGGYSEVTLGVHMPATNRVDGVMANGWRTLLLITHLPVDDKTTHTRFVQLRNVLRSPLADGISRRFSLKILAEDRPTVESQVPRAVPLEPGADVSTRADALTLAYRKLLRAYVDRGWLIDHNEVRRSLREDDRLHVIASPRRRDPELARAWVLDEVPVVVRPREPASSAQRNRMRKLIQ